MSITIPSLCQAGDTWLFAAEYDNYPSSLWTLSFTIKTKDQSSVSLTTASLADESYTVSASSSVTAALPAGSYIWVAKVSNGSEAYTLEKGTLTVIPDLANAGSTYDARSFNKRMMESLETVLEGTADSDVLEQTIGSRTFKSMTRSELLRHYSHFKRLVSIESGIPLFKPIRLI